MMPINPTGPVEASSDSDEEERRIRSLYMKDAQPKKSRIGGNFQALIPSFQGQYEKEDLDLKKVQEITNKQ